MYRKLIAALAAGLCSATSAFAQPLADRIPANPVAYVGWSGSEYLGKDYPASHLKAVLDASDFSTFINDYLPKLADKLGDKGAQPDAMAKALGSMASVMWRHPSAISISDIKIVDNQPIPRTIFICDAGDDAAGIKQQLTALLGDSTGNGASSPTSLRMVSTGNVVALTIGYASDELVLVGPADDAAYRHDPLSKDDAFLHTIGHLQTSPVGVGYIDFDRLFKIIETQLNRGVELKDPATATKESQQWNKFSEALGLKGLHHVACSSAFDGPNWSSVVFIDAPAPRSGLVGLLDNGPIADDFLRVIPKSAAAAAASRFDLAKLYVEIRQTLGKISPDSKAQFDSAMSQVPATLGFDVKPDLLDAMGDHWACYVDRNVGGTGMLGTVMVNKVRDAEKLEATLGMIEKFLSSVMNSQQAGQPGKVTLQQSKAGDLVVHYVAAPAIAPCWAIADGNLYLGLYPQVVIAAANHVTKKAPSLFENQGFIALQDRLKTKKYTGMQFFDLPQTAGESYGSILLLSRTIQGAGDMSGEISPMLLVPPLSSITPHLGPAGSFSVTDASGWYLRSSSPFPGSEIFGTSSFAAGPVGALLMTGFMKGAMTKAAQLQAGN